MTRSRLASPSSRLYLETDPSQIHRTRADLKVPERIAATANKVAKVVSVCRSWLTAAVVEQISQLSIKN